MSMVLTGHNTVNDVTTAQPRLRGCYLLAAALAALAPLALLIDLPMYRLFQDTGLPGDLRRLVDMSEVFAHGLGVAMILVTVFVLDPPRRRAIVRLFTCSLGAGIAANIVKISVGRIRPRGGVPDTVWESFQGWFPALTFGLEKGMDSNLHSFPSAHAATAAGFAVALSMIYPRGRWLFAVLAMLAAVQRIQANAHYASDTLAGAALGCLVAGICCDHRLAGRWFDRFENASKKSK